MTSGKGSTAVPNPGISVPSFSATTAVNGVVDCEGDFGYSSGSVEADHCSITGGVSVEIGSLRIDMILGIVIEIVCYSWHECVGSNVARGLSSGETFIFISFVRAIHFYTFPYNHSFL